jgi:hypothetical protein
VEARKHLFFSFFFDPIIDSKPNTSEKNQNENFFPEPNDIPDTICPAKLISNESLKKKL